MTIVFLQSLKNQRTTILVLCLALIAFEALIAATFNSLYEGLPDLARDLLRAGGGSPTAYQAAIGFRHPMFLVVVVGFVIAASSGAMAREIERGTAFILLARPIERYKVVLVRVATMVIVLLLMLLAAFVGVALGAQVFGLPELDYGLLALGQVNALFLLTAVAGYSLFVSSLSNDGGKATSIAGGLAVASSTTWPARWRGRKPSAGSPSSTTTTPPPSSPTGCSTRSTSGYWPSSRPPGWAPPWWRSSGATSRGRGWRRGPSSTSWPAQPMLNCLEGAEIPIGRAHAGGQDSTTTKTPPPSSVDGERIPANFLCIRLPKRLLEDEHPLGVLGWSKRSVLAPP